MLIECSECKRQVAKEATKCPQCGHRLPAGERKNVLVMGIVFLACAVFSPLLLRSLGGELPMDLGTWMILLGLLGTAAILFAMFHNFEKK
jgi:DNA-directed RNA polymerase subunit RPC12/RpoP